MVSTVLIVSAVLHTYEQCVFFFFFVFSRCSVSFRYRLLLYFDNSLFSSTRLQFRPLTLFTLLDQRLLWSSSHGLRLQVLILKSIGIIPKGLLSTTLQRICNFLTVSFFTRVSETQLLYKEVHQKDYGRCPTHAGT